MCLIVASQKGTVAPDYVLSHAYKSNKDGWGVMSARDGKVVVEKGLHEPALLAAVRRAEGVPHVVHLRYATHGLIDVSNTHPFKIRDGLFMAHNGMLDVPIRNENRSDTWHYARMVSGVLSKTPSWYGTPDFISFQADFIGRKNKLAFLDRSGEIKLVNEQEGAYIDGMWFSQTYSLPMRYENKTSPACALEECCYCSQPLDERSPDGVLCLDCAIKDAEYMGDYSLAYELHQQKHFDVGLPRSNDWSYSATKRRYATFDDDLPLSQNASWAVYPD